MTIAVTGATGALGTHVIDHLLKRVPAAEIVALARDLQKATPLAAKGVNVRHFDYTQPDHLAEALDDVTDLLLISGNAVGSRFTQHQAVIDAAKYAGVRRLVYTSVLDAPNSINPVAPEHVQTEAYLAESGIPHVLLRNGWYSENHQSDVDSAAATGSILTSAPLGSRLATAARTDYAEAAAVVLTTPDAKASYELSGDVAWTHEDLAAIASDLLGKPVEVAHVDAATQTEILTGAGLDAGVVGFIVGVDAAIAAGELGAQSGELSALIGRPTTPLKDSLHA
jgi:NAD(P)H dehydrogenase (quinone)